MSYLTPKNTFAFQVNHSNGSSQNEFNPDLLPHEPSDGVLLHRMATGVYQPCVCLSMNTIGAATQVPWASRGGPGVAW